MAEVVKLALTNIRLREALSEQASHDPLTGLFNRRYMDESLCREIHRSLREGQPLTIAMLDIDHFKLFNDTYGHEASDVVLRNIGHLLRTTLRKMDICCRFGGEELTIILPNTEIQQAVQKINQIREKIRCLDLQHGGQSLPPVTLSGGFAECPTHAQTAETLIRTADIALYAAKHAGRDRLCAPPSLDDTLVD